MDAFVDPGVSTEAPTVQEGMDLLASTRVRTTPDLVEVTVSSRLLAVIQGWSLYRDGQLAASTESNSATLVDELPTPDASHTYTVVLSAPDWVSVPTSDSSYLPATSEVCLDSLESQCVPPIVPETGDGGDEEPEEVGDISGHLLSFSLPIEVPRLSQTSTPMLAESADDDALVRHYTFIQQKFVDAPEAPGQPDYWFRGDDRGFSTVPGASYRAYVRTRVDWSGANVYVLRGIQPTRRHIKRDGTLYYDKQKTGTNDTLVQFIRHRPRRYRVRVRHSVKDPFETWYPAIDYEWEYVVVRDGGITARGLHDGAPNYEIFDEAPHTNRTTRTYIHTYTDFKSLAFPMDQKGKKWCVATASGSGRCPAFGTARWV